MLASSTGNILEYETTSSLIPGNFYSFKVKAINAVGLSEYSVVVVVVAGVYPSQVTPAPYKYSATVG